MKPPESENRLFPIFLKLNLQPILIVGGGAVGLEKVEALLKNDPDANIRIVAPYIVPAIRELAGIHRIEISQREFQVEDLEEVGFVILATDNYELHENIVQLAHERRLLVNVADSPELCDFYLGSTVKKGNLKIGISTNGQSPSIAKRFREVLEEVLPDETDSLLRNLRSIRDKLKGDFSEKVKQLDEITSILRL